MDIRTLRRTVFPVASISVQAKTCHESRQSTLKRASRARCPEGTGVLKNGIPVQKRPGCNGGGGVIGIPGYAACRFQEQVPHALRFRGTVRFPYAIHDEGVKRKPLPCKAQISLRRFPESLFRILKCRSPLQRN